jgi:hypothetical protein
MKLWHNLLIAGCTSFMIVSCSNEQNQANSEHKKLDPSLINNPRSANAEVGAVSNLATMNFVDTSHDFGKMYEGEIASYDFKFTNKGKAPLLISNAAGSCGCTVPDYPHEPIAPGASAVIGVKFNSANKVGLQNKSVNIFTNSQKGTHVLNITAEVIEKQK